MSKYRQLTYGHPVPQSFFDAFQEYISTLATANFALTLAPGSMNQVQVNAGSGNDQVGVGIAGLWRYNTAPVVTQVSAGASDLYVTCTDNVFTTNSSPPPPENDQTNYAFGLTAVAAGATPTGVAHSRKVGQVVAEGTPARILSLRQLVGQVDGQQLLQPGMIQTTAATAIPPGWLLCNGAAVLRSGPTGYAALYAALGGPNSPWGQGDGSTTFQLPDLRGKVQVGAGTGALAGAYNLARSLADVGGTERVTLTEAQMPSHFHPNPATGVNGTGFYDVNHLHGGTTDNIDRALAHTHGVYDQSQPYTGGAGGDPVWSHDANGLSTVWGWGGGIQRMWGNAYLQYLGTGPNTGGNLDHLHTFTTGAADRTTLNHQHSIYADGGGQYHENMPPFAVVNVIIKF